MAKEPSVRLTGRATKTERWLYPVIGVAGAFVNIAILFFFALGLYGISSPDPNPPTSHILGVRSDIFRQFFSISLPGGIWLWLYFKAGEKGWIGSALAVVYFSLIYYFAATTSAASPNNSTPMQSHIELGQFHIASLGR